MNASSAFWQACACWSQSCLTATGSSSDVGIHGLTWMLLTGVRSGSIWSIAPSNATHNEAVLLI